MDFKKKMLEMFRKDKPEKQVHMQQLYDNWSAETNDPETQAWRDDLSPEELVQVEKWDDSFHEGFERMAQDIILQKAKSPDQIGSGLSCYRIMKDPEKSWKPYRSEPMYDDHPEMGSYQSSYGLSSPKAGDYLVTDQTGTSVRTASDRDFEDVRFSAMPSLNEMISTGVVIQVPQQVMDQDLAQKDQIQSITDQIAEHRQHMDDVKDYIADLHSEAKSKAQSENVKTAMDELQKTQIELVVLKGQLTSLEGRYQAFITDCLQTNGNNEKHEFMERAVEFENGVNHAAVQPVARIDYLGLNGKVRESVEYTDLHAFETDIKAQNDYGVPMSAVIFKNVDGSIPPYDFLFEMDPPPKGFSIVDNPCSNEMVQEVQEIEGVRSQRETKANEPAREKGGKSLSELMKSAHDYAQTHTQPVQSKTMVENRGKIR